MSDILLRLLAIVLGSAFLWSAVAKLSDMTGWGRALERYRLPVWAARPVPTGVPLVEAGVTVLFLTSQTRVAGALALALLAAFSLAVLRARRFEGDRLPCGCFGSDRARDYRTMLLRNALLGSVAATLLIEGRDVDLFDGISLDPGRDIVPAMLTLVAILLGLWLFRTLVRSLRGGR